MKNKAQDVELPRRLGVRPLYSDAIGRGCASKLRRMVRDVAWTGAAPGMVEGVAGNGWFALYTMYILASVG